jgi:hypothetical protein
MYISRSIIEGRSVVTHDLGRAFVTFIKVVPGTPLVHTAETRLGAWPYWYGNTVLVKYRPGRVIGIGWWHHPRPDEDEEILMLRAIQGRAITAPCTGHICAPQTCGFDHAKEA